jgi:hypothetical protein
MYLASLVEETKDKVDGYKFIHTKSELDKIVVDNLSSHKVVIRQDFAHEYFTPTGLMSYIENVRKINCNLIIELDINDEVLTRNTMIDKISECRDMSEMIMLQGAYEKEFMDTIRYLIDKNNSDFRQMLAYSNQVSRLQAIVEGLHDELEEKEYTIQTESANKLSYQSKFHALISRINYQYNAGVDKNKLFRVDKNSYDKILYIKELTRVQYTDTLVYYLKEILKTLYAMPTRILVIEGYYAEGKISQYPNLVPHHNLIERDVIKGDILMLGMQPNIMQDILKNSSNISILIVLDRGGYSVPHISGDNVEVLYTVSDLKDAPADIPKGRIISYENSTQFIKYIKGFNEMDMSARISEYSSMSIVKNIISLLERK